MSNNFSIGVPCYKSLVLPLYDMTLTCSNNKSQGINIERDIRQEFSERLANITGCQTTNKSICYLSNINFYANRDSISIFDMDDKQRLVNIYDSLITLDRNKELDELLNSISIRIRELESKRDYIRNNPYTTQFHNELKRDFNDVYYGKSYGCDLRTYLNNECQQYRSSFNNIDSVFDIDCSDLFSTYIDSLDEGKVSLFLAFNYLRGLVESLKNGNMVQAQEFAFYISAYLKLDKNKIVLPYQNYSLSYNFIKSSFERLVSKYPKLKDVYMSRDLFTNNSYEDNRSVIDSIINMDTIRTNEFFIKGGKDNNKKGNNSGNSIEPVSDWEKEQVREYVEHKLYTYLKNKPIAQIICDNKFANYIAYLYENGMITADRLLGIYRLSSTQNDAIYVFDAFNFEDKIKLNKPQLWGNTRRIFHNPGWEDEVDEVANVETSPEYHEEAIRLSKRKRI